MCLHSKRKLGLCWLSATKPNLQPVEPVTTTLYFQFVLYAKCINHVLRLVAGVGEMKVGNPLQVSSYLSAVIDDKVKLTNNLSSTSYIIIVNYRTLVLSDLNLFAGHHIENSEIHLD